VKFMVSAGQHGLVHGYAPLPHQLVQQANTAANQIWTAPPLPPSNTNGGQHQSGGDGQGTVAGSNTGGGSVPTGGTTIPPVTATNPTTDGTTPVTSPEPAVPTLPVLPPPSMLLASSWSKALPLVVVVGFGCLVVGAFLLLGGDLKGKLRRSTAKVKEVSPLRRKQKLRSVGGSDEGEAAA
jgi:hypothetical protein